MCGISGFFGQRKISKKYINQTIQLMKNRGPDFSNHYENHFENDLSIYLLHTRLSIIDLNKRSNQPFIIGDYILIFNGEIYNYIELKKNLLSKGISLRTNSDTEVLLNYYILYGDKCVNYFDGMWSIAIFNKKNKRLFLSRDPFGEKPLYIFKNKAGIFFGSEIKLIKSLSNESFSINSKKLNRYLSFGARCLFKDNSTFYEKIISVKNSENIICDSNLKIVSKIYWKPKPKIKFYKNDDIEEISKNLLIKSLSLRLRSDVPAAFLLSGGIDSGGLASIAVKKLNKNIRTFSIVDNDNRYNEIKNIKKVTSDLNCKNHVVEISKKKFIKNLKSLIYYHDSPVFTLAQYLHFELMSNIKPTGIKVVISGTGADEIYSGYYDHYLMHLACLRKKNVYSENLKYWKSFIKNKVRNPIFKKNRLFIDNPNFREHVYDNSETISKNLINPEKFLFEENFFSEDLFSNRRANELFNETVPAILNNEDLNAMMNSIENRSPFLNREIFNFVYSIPPENLIKRGYSKYILRESLKNILHEDVRTDRQKKGFNCSIKTLVNFSEKSTQEFLLDGGSQIFDYVNRDRIKALFKENLNENYISKFLFSFISAKLFLDNQAAQ